MWVNVMDLHVEQKLQLPDMTAAEQPILLLTGPASPALFFSPLPSKHPSIEAVKPSVTCLACLYHCLVGCVCERSFSLRGCLCGGPLIGLCSINEQGLVRLCTFLTRHSKWALPLVFLSPTPDTLLTGDHEISGGI